MILYDPLLVIHILAAVTWLGGGLMLSVMGIRARSAPGSGSDFAKLLPFVGLRLLMPAVLLVLVTGIAMVAIDSEWSFGQAWILLALGLFAIAFLVGAVYLSRIGIAMERAAADLSILPTLLNRWLAGYALVLVVLVAIVVDMVFKPGAG